MSWKQVFQKIVKWMGVLELQHVKTGQNYDIQLSEYDKNFKNLETLRNYSEIFLTFFNLYGKEKNLFIVWGNNRCFVEFYNVCVRESGSRCKNERCLQSTKICFLRKSGEFPIH